MAPLDRFTIFPPSAFKSPIFKELKFLRSRPNAELRKVTENYRVSVDNFQRIDFDLSQISERAAARRCRPMGTFSVRRGAWTPAPWADTEG